MASCLSISILSKVFDTIMDPFTMIVIVKLVSAGGIFFMATQ
jgi:hypothetical protein